MVSAPAPTYQASLRKRCPFDLWVEDDPEFDGDIVRVNHNDMTHEIRLTRRVDRFEPFLLADMLLARFYYAVQRG